MQGAGRRREEDQDAKGVTSAPSERLRSTKSPLPFVTRLRSVVSPRRFPMLPRRPPQHVDIAVKSGDSPAEVAAQWGLLRGLFAREDTVLVIHLTNHYALVRLVGRGPEAAVPALCLQSAVLCVVKEARCGVFSCCTAAGVRDARDVRLWRRARAGGAHRAQGAATERLVRGGGPRYTFCVLCCCAGSMLLDRRGYRAQRMGLFALRFTTGCPGTSFAQL